MRIAQIRKLGPTPYGSHQASCWVTQFFPREEDLIAIKRKFSVPKKPQTLCPDHCYRPGKAWVASSLPLANVGLRRHIVVSANRCSNCKSAHRPIGLLPYVMCHQALNFGNLGNLFEIPFSDCRRWLGDHYALDPRRAVD